MVAGTKSFVQLIPGNGMNSAQVKPALDQSKSSPLSIRVCLIPFDRNT